jgi:hypothetical protein
MPFNGHLPLQRVHRGTLDPWVDYKRKEGRAPGTINHGLKVVRRILTLAELEWMDEFGPTWLDRAPRIKLPLSALENFASCHSFKFFQHSSFRRAPGTPAARKNSVNRLDQ